MKMKHHNGDTEDNIELEGTMPNFSEELWGAIGIIKIILRQEVAREDFDANVVRLISEAVTNLELASDIMGERG